MFAEEVPLEPGLVENTRELRSNPFVGTRWTKLQNGCRETCTCAVSIPAGMSRDSTSSSTWPHTPYSLATGQWSVSWSWAQDMTELILPMFPRGTRNVSLTWCVI